ncbi:hypothetical protein RJ639_007843 [Escallonia herrerae]|uniref:F-box domain-containing protein n=1 Tax=Escallonia herrerae TaxID=1293975 RepID=A0AA89AVW5_9ASTE|nr:hypothetical protein RJ639_007843 [Escallonia herrerae]
MSSTSTTTSAAGGGATEFSTVHPDIIQAHILTRLDGPTLASASAASPLLHALCTEEKLWTDISNSTFPSTDHPRLCQVISTFPDGHRSFFSDAFPTLNNNHRLSSAQHRRSTPASELISAVDIHYQNQLIFSKVEVTEATSEWFTCSPFRLDLLDQKETVPTPVKFEADDNTCRLNLEKNMILSWVIIDPTRKRAVNLSTRKPVSVQKHWLTGEVQLKYATVIAGDGKTEAAEFIQCNAVITCGGKEGGELRVSEVSLQLQDMDGKSLSGKDTLVILQGAMDGERRKSKEGEEKERYEEYLEMKRERTERKQRRERRLDMLCIATGVTIFVAFWAYILLR